VLAAIIKQKQPPGVTCESLPNFHFSTFTFPASVLSSAASRLCQFINARKFVSLGMKLFVEAASLQKIK
jgi:hypothetical protein